MFAELGSKFGWVRAKNPSELGSENRKKNPGHQTDLAGFFFERSSTRVHSTKFPENRVFGFSNRVFGFLNRVFGVLEWVFGFKRQLLGLELN